MTMWIARDPNGELYLFDEKPYYRVDYGFWMHHPYAPLNADKMVIHDIYGEFEDITFENSPIEVELKIKSKDG